MKALIVISIFTVLTFLIFCGCVKDKKNMSAPFVEYRTPYLGAFKCKETDLVTLEVNNYNINVTKGNSDSTLFFSNFPNIELIIRIKNGSSSLFYASEPSRGGIQSILRGSYVNNNLDTISLNYSYEPANFNHNYEYRRF